jgi:nucleoside-diphosphate-sugar epimerase
VAEQLRARGVRVVALQRAASDTRFLEDIGCEIVEGDVRQPAEQLADTMGGVEAVLHAAALVYSGGSWPQVREVNVEGTRNIVRAAALAGAAHVVHVSSIAVYGTVLGVAHEGVPLESPLRPGNTYGRSKREAERVAKEVGDEEGVSVTSVRPAAVYGERDRLFAPKLAGLARLPVMPMLGSGKNLLPVVYAGNVARGIMSVLSGRGVGQTFNLSEDEPLTQRALLEGFARGLGRRPRLVSIPAVLIRAGVDITSRLDGSVPGLKGLSLERVARLGLGDNPYPADHARKVLTWTDHVPHEEALRRTAQWWLGT